MMERYGYSIFSDDIRNEPGGKLSFGVLTGGAFADAFAVGVVVAEPVAWLEAGA